MSENKLPMYRFGMFSNSADGTRQAKYVQCNIEKRLHNRCCHQKNSITYSECVFITLVTQHAKHMRHILLSSVACPAVPYFSQLSHKWRDFFLNVIRTWNVYFDFLCNFYLKNFSFSEEFSDVLSIINVHRSLFKVPVIFVRFSSILSFLNRLLKIPQISHFMIIRLDTELFTRARQTYRCTDIYNEAINCFDSFSYARSEVL